MAKAHQRKLVALKLGLLEEQKNYLRTVLGVTEKVIGLANDSISGAEEARSETFTRLNDMLEEMILFLSDTCGDLPDELDGYETFNVKQMQKAISSLQAKIRPHAEISKGEQLETAQGSDNCLKTEQEITQLQKDTQAAIQSVIQLQSDLNENSQAIKNIIKEHAKNMKRHKKQLETLTATQDNMSDIISTLSSRTDLLETKVVDHTQLNDLEMRCEILEVGSENMQGKLDNVVCFLEELESKLGEALENQMSNAEVKNLLQAECKINKFEEEWAKSKEEIEEFRNDAITKNKQFWEIVAKRLRPLEKLRNIFNKHLDERKDHLKKMDRVCGQITDLRLRFTLLERTCFFEGDVNPMDRADLLLAFRKITRCQDFKDNDSSMLSRIHELGLKCGSALNEHHTKCKRVTLNQFRTESKYGEQSIGCVVHKSGFSVSLANRVVGFNDIIANIGDHFDTVSGKFTAPVDGMYVVSLNVNGDVNLTVLLVKQLNGGSVNHVCELDNDGSCGNQQLESGDGKSLNQLLGSQEESCPVNQPLGSKDGSSVNTLLGSADGCSTNAVLGSECEHSVNHLLGSEDTNSVNDTFKSEILLGKVTTTVKNNTASAFVVTDLKVGDKLYVKYIESCFRLLGDCTFAIFRIGKV